VRLIEAAKVLYGEGSRAEALGMLVHVRDGGTADEFEALLALLEVGAVNDIRGTHFHVQEELFPQIFNSDFWMRRTLSEQGNFFEWSGLIAFGAQSFDDAAELLSRAASLGRDSPLLWRTLGSLCFDRGDFDLGVRYLRRSLQLLRQVDLGLLAGRELPLGFFSGHIFFADTMDVADYMRILLAVTKVAKGRKNLKMARELLLEMIHQFPLERRLSQIRLMIERNIVESSVLVLTPARAPIETGRIPLISRQTIDI